MAYSADLYVHDLDRRAADALNQFPKFVKLLEAYSANYDEKLPKSIFYRLQSVSVKIRCRRYTVLCSLSAIS